jgi:hypothetical protein
MNKLERLIYDQLKSNPAIKKSIVDVYQNLLALVPIRRVYSQAPLSIRPGSFFGFHDKCPWSGDGRYLLANRYHIPLHMPGPEDKLEIGFYAGDNWTDFRSLTHTQAWNWQMGAQLQWLGSSKKLLFNDCIKERHVSRLLEADGTELNVFSRPIAATSPDGKWAAGHSFTRMRHTVHSVGYAYANSSETDDELGVTDNSFLYVIDLSSGKVNNLFSVQDIAAHAPDDTMQDAFHYFTHCLFSPSNNRFVFFHRWVKNNNKYWTRMFSCNLDGSDLYLFPTSGFVSHINWRDRDHILAYSSTQQYGDGYHLFTDLTGGIEHIAAEAFSSDGHPQYSPSGRWILTDTYPDRFRRQYLTLYDTETELKNHIATLRIPLEYRYDVRCDFHPRWSRDGKTVCFDSAHTGTRSLCTMSVADLV